MYPLVGPIVNVDVSVSTMLEYCISSKLDLAENLPCWVCLQCFKTIRIAYLFLLQYRQTQEKIHELIMEPAAEAEGEPTIQEYVVTDESNWEYIVEHEPVHQEGIVTNGYEEKLKELKIDPIQCYTDENSSQIEYEIQEESDASKDESYEKVESVVEEEAIQNSNSSLRAFKQMSGKFVPFYKCPMCHTTFRQYHVFQRHIYSYNMKDITCTRCTDNHIFQIDEYLEHYKKMHRYECDICDKRMVSHYGFQYHMRLHMSDKKFVCTFGDCKRSYLFEDVLKKHMQTHTENRMYPCHLCDRVFRTSDMCRYHIRHHDGKRNFLCTYCGRTFVQAVHLRYHVSKHIGERPYSCELCEKSFRVKPHLTKHFKGCLKKQQKQGKLPSEEHGCV